MKKRTIKVKIKNGNKKKPERKFFFPSSEEIKKKLKKEKNSLNIFMSHHVNFQIQKYHK